MPTARPTGGLRARQEEPTPFGAALARPLTRIGARLIDGIVLSPVLLIAVARAGGPAPAPGSGVPVLPPGALIASFVISAIYEIVLVAVRGQTVGHMALRIRVVRQADGAIPGWATSIARWVTLFAVGAVPVVGPYVAIVGYLWMVWDPRRQGWQDKVARTLVVRLAPAGAGGPGRPPGPDRP